MLQFFIQVLLGPVKPPNHNAQMHGESRPCNVVGGCGAGCLCAPEHSEGRPRTGPPGSDQRIPPEKGDDRPPDRQEALRKAAGLAWHG